MIQVQKLTKKFGGTTVLKDLSFEVKKSEIVGFLGPNGAGKTTTMRILTGFLSPSSGSIKIGDFDLEENLLEIRKKIGYLPENTPLYTDLRVYEALNFVAETKNIKPYGDSYKHVIQTCGLKEVITKPISELSKGYRQRVGLAQALLGNPDILILDEPTSGLDPNQIKEVRSVIKKIGETKTIILSTHILQEVSAMCDRAIIIHKGEIAAQGTVQELTQAGQGSEIINALIEGPREAIASELRMLGQGMEVFDKGMEENATLFSVTGPRTIDLRRLIYKTAVRNQWVLLEMERQQRNLEDVFHKLTTNT